jgi:superfamily II DNA or RNA helicase
MPPPVIGSIEESANEESAKLTTGTQVHPVGQPNRVGVVLGSLTRGNGLPIYRVFFGPNDTALFPASNLVVVTPEIDESPSFVDAIEFRKDLAIAKIRGRLTDTLYSVQASRTELVPYQFLPVLKFIERGDGKLLLADEVGLGKTIEAALIMSELKTRTGGLDRILIVCPSRLTEKWRLELANRFDEDFQILNAAGFRTLLSQYVNSRGTLPFQNIIGLETIRSAELLDLAEEAMLTLDMVIIDEAHHLRNPSTAQHRAGRFLSEFSESTLLLTATPVQLGSQDLFQLLNILDENEFEDLSQFEALQAPNAVINEASRALGPGPSEIEETFDVLTGLERGSQRGRYRNDPIYLSVKERLYETESLSPVELATIHRDLRRLNTFAGIIARTTKREVSSAAVRVPNVISVTLAPEESRYYESVLNFTREHYRRTSGDMRSAPGFATVQRERQAASCLKATAEYFEEWLKDSYADIGAEDVENWLVEDSVEDSDQSGLNDAIVELIEAGRGLPDHDTKLANFFEALRALKSERADAKILLFSTFKRTLKYLERLIRSELQDVVDVVYHMDGDTPIQQRGAIVEQFRTTEGFVVLLSSEVGGEGLDFQFTDTLFNYDLPWNPMVVEQRIGRLDRFGQKSERINIYSFVLASTIEERILQRLYDRIQIFENSLGDLATILGGQVRQLERSLFNPNLTDEQREEELESALRRIEIERLNQEQLDDQRAQLLNQDVLVKNEVEQLLDSGRYLTSSDLQAVVDRYISDQFNGTRLDGQRDNVFRLSARPDFVATFSSAMKVAGLPIERRIQFIESLNRRQGFPVTFDSDIARTRPLVEFLHFRHPITSTAAMHFTEKSPPAARTRIGNLKYEAADPELTGTYFVFLFHVDITGEQPISELLPIVVNENGDTIKAEIGNRALQYLSGGVATSATQISAAEFDQMESAAIEGFAEVRDVREAAARARNGALIDARLNSLRQIHGARRRRYDQQLRSVSDERIRRMRESQIVNLDGRFEQQTRDLEEKRELTVSGDLVVVARLELSSTNWTPPPAIVQTPEMVSPAIKETPAPPAAVAEPPQSEYVAGDDTQRRYAAHSTRDGRALNCGDAHGKRGVFAVTQVLTHEQAVTWWSRPDAPTTFETDVEWRRMRDLPVAPASPSTPQDSSRSQAVASPVAGPVFTDPVTRAVQIAAAQELLVIDNRGKGGLLWIIDPNRSATDIGRLGFDYSDKGGRATNHQGAWHIK